MQKSIRLLHERIGFALKWNWAIFISANLIFLLMFIWMNILNLKNSSAVWKEFFLHRLMQVENIDVDSDQDAPIPVVHTLVIAADGTIRKSPFATLQGMRLNASGFFGKIDHLQPGQNTIIFFPDMVDGVQRVHFVKRLADEFIIKSFEPNDFFPISLSGDTNLSVVTGGVIWFSDDPKQIGDLYKYAPMSIDSGHLQTAFSDQIPEMPDASLVIRQDITNQLQILLLTASSLMIVFGGASLLTMKIQKDFTILQAEQKEITQFIQTLSRVILRSDETLSTRFAERSFRHENLAPILRQSFSASHATGSTTLQFEENQQVRLLVQKLTEDILLLVETVEEDGARLRESEARFRAVVEHSSDGVIFMSAEREIGYVSPAYEKFLGYTPQEMVGHFGMEYIYPEDRVFIAQTFREILQTPAKPVTVEYRLQRKDGSYCWVETTTANLLADPHVQAVVLNQRDISERKEVEDALRESKDQMEMAQTIGHTGSWVYNLETGKIWGTVEAHRIFGLAAVAGDFLLEDIEACIPERERVHQALVDLISEGQEYDLEYAVTPADGAPSRVIHSIARLGKFTQGNPLKIFGFIQDITERKQAEDDRIAREIAEQANRAKSEFISRMSHELRTPLNAILGFSQLLKMDELKPNQARGVDQIHKSGRHLLNLVNEVLNIARIESGRMQISPEPVRLADTLQEALELIRPLAEGRGISIGLENLAGSDIFVQADPQSLRQVLLNLLSNAVKYNREGGEIAITSSLTNDGHLRLQVRDTGEGIPPEKMERLFTPFDRLDRDSIEQDGTGLGLALSKGLVEAMGGRIGADSQPGVGSTFWLELKLVTDDGTTPQ